MRYIAILLLIANIAYFVWWQAGIAPAVEPVQTEPVPLLNTGLLTLEEYRRQQEELNRQLAEAQRQCSVVSGFPSLDDARAFQDAASELALEAELRLTGDPIPSQFRVFLPPASSRAVATLMLENLGEASAQLDPPLESYLVTRGLLENAIALGVYDSRGEAIRVQTAVQSLGYSPEIQELPRSEGPLEVLLIPQTGAQIRPAEWLDLSAESPGLTRTENLCQTIAPTGQFP